MLLSLVLAILVALALAPAVAAAPVAPIDAAARAGAGDHDDARDDDDDRSGPGGGDRDDSDDSDDDCSRPRDDDEDPVVISGPIPSGTSVIDIFDDDCFTPDVATIDLGGSVTFVNHHSDEHTATGSAFDTGLIDTGETATVTLDTPGTFAFGCIIHPEMTGTIAVRDESGVVPSPTPPASAPPVAGAIEEVAIIDFAFEPSESVVAIGTTVKWTVTQASPHTVTAADGSFDSGILDVGGTFQHTFLDPGSFAYACILHPQMQATVVVGPSLPAVSPLPGASAGPSPSAGP
jgi:plastocyanin